MYPESQAAMEEMKPAFLETSSVFEAIKCPYAPKLVKSYLIKVAKFDNFYVLHT